MSEDISQSESELVRRHPTIQILLIEDSAFVRESITETLRREGYQVLEAATGEEGLAQLAAFPVDLILLDIVLPDMDGFRVCETIRKQSDVPIVMLTALYHSDDILRGFELGADDYITKPFAAPELLSRICSIVRRVGGSAETQSGRPFRILSDITLNQPSGVATVAGKTVDLSPIEARLLSYLMERPNRSIAKEELFREVWGYELAGGTNLVEAAIRRLRTKVEKNPSAPDRIVTVHSFGYRLNVFAEGHSGRGDDRQRNVGGQEQTGNMSSPSSTQNRRRPRRAGRNNADSFGEQRCGASH
jgi:DNA-binding response OmpR family regulator